MGNCASTPSPAGGSPDNSAVLHRDAERRMREASRILSTIISYTSTVAYITSQTKKVLTNTAKVGTPHQPRPQPQHPVDPHYRRTSNRSYYLVLETLESPPSSKYLLRPLPLCFAKHSPPPLANAGHQLHPLDLYRDRELSSANMGKPHRGHDKNP